jgi:DNA-directed RNA polymerase subunit RPC12/RpoP
MRQTLERSAPLEGEQLQREYSCTRCGQNIPATAMAKRKERGSQNTWCSDCNSGARSKIAYGDFVCTPWQGEVDLDTLEPIDAKGRPYLPGYRTCGHADCVNRKHIQPPRTVVPGRTGILGGRVITYEDLMNDLAEVKKEGR